MTVFDREHYYRDLLARQVGGRTEVVLPFGRADVMTETTVWEVEPASRYPAGVRQALQYASQTGLTAALATYGPGTLVTKVFDHLAKLPAPGVELWWLHERRFVPIETAEQAAALSAYADGGPYPIEIPSQPCEVIEQDDDVVRSCDGRPVIRQPVRLCQDHADQILRHQPPLPPPAIEPGDDERGFQGYTPGRTLKTAEDMAGLIQHLAWPYLDPDSRALLGAYLIEVRSIIWHAAMNEPDAVELFDGGYADYELEEG